MKLPCLEMVMKYVEFMFAFLCDAFGVFLNKMGFTIVLINM